MVIFQEDAKLSLQSPFLISAAAVSVILAQATATTASAAVGDKLDLSGLIQLPTENWSSFEAELYTPRNSRSDKLMWRSSWAAAGDQPGQATLNQSVMSARPYGHSNASVANDGPTAETALHYNPFSVVTRPDGSKALRITPKYLSNPADRAKVWGYPILSGEISTAGKNDGPGRLEFYASNYSVTIYRGVRLPTAMWAALWKIPRADYGHRGVTEPDLVETLQAAWPRVAWLSLHSDDATWRAAIASDPQHYDPSLTGAAGPKNVSLRYRGLDHTDPHALHDWALVVGPCLTQWAIDGVVVLELPTPNDIGPKLFHDIIDLDYPSNIRQPTSQADLDYLEIGAIERYTYPGLSRVTWRQKDVGDGGGVAGAKRLPGKNFQ